METYVHKSIRHCLTMIAPFEASEKEMEKGQLQFYQFMVSIYQGMYQNPEKYLVFPGPYEEYIAKSKAKVKEAAAEKKHKSDARESTLRNTFQQAIQFYALYLYNLGLVSTGIDEQSNSLIVSKEAYDSAIDKMNRIHDSKYNSERYQVLTELGVQVNEATSFVYINHKSYKCAMLGLHYLCKAPDSKYKLMNYLRLDFKNAYSPMPTVEDIKKTLPVKSAEVINKLEDSMMGMKIKANIKPLRGIVSDFKWKVEYAFKGKNICGFYADNDYFMLCVYFNHYQNINDFAYSLWEEDYDLFQWLKDQFPERLCKCPSNRRVHFGEETRRICGLSNRTETVNPSDTDLENSIKILKKFRNLI